jgi:hypothetical protein
MVIETHGDGLACGAEGALHVRCTSSSAGRKRVRLVAAAAARCALGGAELVLAAVAAWLGRRWGAPPAARSASLRRAAELRGPPT